MSDLFTVPAPSAALLADLDEGSQAIVATLFRDTEAAARRQVRLRVEDVFVRLTRDSGWCDEARVHMLRVFGTPKGPAVPRDFTHRATVTSVPWRREYRDSDGLDCRLFDVDGWKDGRDGDGYDRDGYDRDGYNRQGLNKEGQTIFRFNPNGWDIDGFNAQGVDRDGYTRDGYDYRGRDRSGYDRQGFNSGGYDRDGYNASGLDMRGIARDGLDLYGRKPYVFDRNGLDPDGYDYAGRYASNTGRPAGTPARLAPRVLPIDDSTTID